MSNFKRETIVFVGAIVGANLLAFFNQPKPVRSLDCFQSFEQIKQSASRALLPSNEVPQGEPIGSYYDVRTKRDTPYYQANEAPAAPQAMNGHQQSIAAPSSGKPSEVSASPAADTAPTFPVARTEVAPVGSGAVGTAALDAELDTEISREHGLTLEPYRASLSQGGVY